jgi:hypothetical protein
MQPKKYKGKRIALLTWLAALIVLWLCLLGFSAQAQYQTESSWAHCQEYTGMETGYYWLCPSGVYTRFAGYYVDFMLTDDAINLVFLFEDSGIYYCHAPYPTTDLWANFALFGDDGECYYDSSPICDPSPAGNFIVSGGSYNDPYMVTFIRGDGNVDLPSQGYRVDTLEDVVGLTLLDYTSFHRLFIDKEDGIKYVYKVKNPKSHIDELIRIQNESN